MGGRSGQSIGSDSSMAIENVNGLPQGSTFEDAKKIDGIFNRSVHTWSETIEAFEKNKTDSNLTSVNVADIKITQPNIQSNKVEAMISKKGELPIINAVQFKDEIVIYDGHHRLTAAWATGETKIKVNLVKL